MQLKDKVAIVTGASRGIGLEIATRYLQEGAKVALVSRKQEVLDELVADLKKTYPNVIGVAAHTGDRDAVEAMVAEVTKTWGGVDILVNNAATNPHFGPILTAEASHWDKILDVNLKGYFWTAQLAWPSMRERGGGKIINIASVAARTPLTGMGIYCVSKAGVVMLTKVLAVELANFDIQVNAILPGFIETRFSQAIQDNERLNKSVLRATPQGRMGQPEEMAGLALYLASSASSYTTGAEIVADGGFLNGIGAL